MIRPVFLCVSFPLIACSAALAQDKTSLNRGGYGSVMTPEQVVRELGPETGLLPGDQAYEGRPVKSVSVRYRSTGKTVSEDRLKNLLATQPGTNYSPEVVNKDLERLLESGLVGGNTTVAVEPSGDGVTVVFEMAAQNLLGGVGFRGNTAFDNRDLSEECGLKGRGSPQRQGPQQRHLQAAHLLSGSPVSGCARFLFLPEDGAPRLCGRGL